MMRGRAVVCVLVICGAVVLALPAAAGVIYDNGPATGEIVSIDIKTGGLRVLDGFAPLGLQQPMSGMTIGVWLDPGDALQSIQVTFWLQPDGTQQYFTGTLANFTEAGCFTNSRGKSVCNATGQLTSAGPSFASGTTYWLELSNAVTQNTGSLGWDLNAGIGCTSLNCPAQAVIVGEGSIDSESFTILGNVGLTPSPEPGSLVLLASGVVGLVGVVRRKMVR